VDSTEESAPAADDGAPAPAADDGAPPHEPAVDPADAQARGPRERDRPRRRSRPAVGVDPRYGRYVGLFALLLLVLFTINTIVTKPNGAKGIAPGASVAPFAVPLVTAPRLVGNADVATRPNQGSEGNVPACQERGPEILNICELYERGPVVLTLFIYAGSCEAILGDMQAIAPSFPGVRFAAVSIKGNRAALRRLVRKRGLAFPVGLDEEGILARLYKLASCPQVTFVLPNGVVQSEALLSQPSRATLRARVAELVAAARARGWRGGAG
jgi:hypothetical protein